MEPQGNASQSPQQLGGAPTGETAPMNNKGKNTLMGILSYIGPLVIIPFFVAKEDPFVKFHIKQGLVLFIASIIVWVLGSMFYGLWMIFQIINLAILILAILGIVNVVRGEEKELPLVGQLSRYFSF